MRALVAPTRRWTRDKPAPYHGEVRHRTPAVCRSTKRSLGGVGRAAANAVAGTWRGCGKPRQRTCSATVDAGKTGGRRYSLAYVTVTIPVAPSERVAVAELSQPILILASFTTLPQRSVWSLTKARNCSGVFWRLSILSRSKCSLTSGVRIAALIARLREFAIA